MMLGIIALCVNIQGYQAFRIMHAPAIDLNQDGSIGKALLP